MLAWKKQSQINWAVEEVRKGAPEEVLYDVLRSTMPYLEHNVDLDLSKALEVLKERGRA